MLFYAMFLYNKKNVDNGYLLKSDYYPQLREVKRSGGEISN